MAGGRSPGTLEISRLGAIVRYGSKCYTFRVSGTSSSTLRVFASKPSMRFARRFGIDDKALWETLNRAHDADLGGGVFKLRLARQGEGVSGGARALVAMKIGKRAVLMFGFEKKDLANIKPDELKGYRKAAKNLPRLHRGRDYGNREGESSL
jgi:hypothetical protein